MEWRSLKICYCIVSGCTYVWRMTILPTKEQPMDKLDNEWWKSLWILDPWIDNCENNCWLHQFFNEVLFVLAAVVWIISRTYHKLFENLTFHYNVQVCVTLLQLVLVNFMLSESLSKILEIALLIQWMSAVCTFFSCVFALGTTSTIRLFFISPRCFWNS